MLRPVALRVLAGLQTAMCIRGARTPASSVSYQCMRRNSYSFPHPGYDRTPNQPLHVLPRRVTTLEEAVASVALSVRAMAFTWSPLMGCRILPWLACCALQRSSATTATLTSRSIFPTRPSPRAWPASSAFANRASSRYQTATIVLLPCLPGEKCSRSTCRAWQRARAVRSASTCR